MMQTAEGGELLVLISNACRYGFLSPQNASQLSQWLVEAERLVVAQAPVSALEQPTKRTRPIADCRVPGAPRPKRGPSTHEQANQTIKANANLLFGDRPLLPGERAQQFDFEPVHPSMTDSGRGRS